MDIHINRGKIMTKECYMCGTDRGLTNHHVINRSMHPKHNTCIYLCRNCHKLFHTKQPPHLKMAWAFVKDNKITVKYINKDIPIKTPNLLGVRM